ncbi:MAG: ribonucleoside-diphosphate reductase subunit alpha, partial [Candidatus Thiodiazotropha sp. (ex Clathrolucina costata)]|nr:ribonucleoside-diphosphate reductase subunit alpha [Candidatus Thiodiazotropha taylori]
MQEPQAQARSSSNSGIQVIRRNGKVTHFDPGKISVAMTKAFLAVEGGSAAASSRIHDTVKMLTDQVVSALTRRLPDNARVHIEDIQDQVELSLMRSGEHKAARSYVLYRERQSQKRLEEEAKRAEVEGIPEEHIVNVTLDDGSTRPLDVERMQALVSEACNGLDEVDAGRILQEACRNLFDGVKESDVSQTLVMSARTLIDQEPNYSQVAARLLLDILRREALGFLGLDTPVNTQAEMAESYCSYFKRYIQQAAELDLLDSRLGQYDLDRLIAAIKPERDLGFTYLGLQTLYDRYFIHSEDGVRFELPQAFFMRVAMGLAINEIDRESRAIEFYDLLSSFDFMSSTPTLFNSGTLRPQLSSCYLTTVPDDLDGIYSSIKDNALLSKFAGGLGNDWTRVRGLGAHIKGTNGKSQGVVPFLKVANDTAVAVNQGGKRKGAVCAYLETWHIDIEEFLELRKNTGDERRRTHDMNTANWIPDLFMKRVAEEGNWTLFSPNDTPDLHDLTGKAFEKAYLAYEEKAAKGLLDVSKRVKAVELWRKMLGLLFETGHPWITFKDPCNLRYSNQHMGVVHSSNLCTEITLHTNDHEIAVCNLGSVNLTAHVNDKGLDLEKLEKTVTTAMRMLDNVIDYNYYSVPQARHSNLRHRPVGLGIMGFQDALYKQRLAYTSEEALAFADRAMEAVSYYAIQASSDMAAERGRYSSYEGSLWSQGILPIDSLQLLKEQRGDYLQVDESQSLDWDALRAKIKRQGMRNSNTMAIAPTATISNICGVSQSIEPTYQNLFVKSNLSGEFTVVNPYMVHDLKKLGLWDEVMINDLKYYDGSLQPIDRIPAELKAVYATAFEIDPRWLVEAASRRQKWIDQG